MEYKCPLYESSQYTCDRDAVHLVQGTAICSYNAMKMALRVNEQGQIAAAPVTKVPA